MSAPSAEHAKAHANEAAKAAPGGKPSEGGHVVDGSLFDILTQLKENLIATAAVPAAVYEHEHAKGGDHPKDKGDHPKADHPKKEGEAKKAEGGDHPKPHDDALAKHKKEEMLGDAARLATTIPAAYKAWKAGNLETDDIAHVIDPLVDMASTSPWLRTLVGPMAMGAKWLLNWGLGANEHVHETDPVFEKLGKQIMGFPQDKDGTYHHACEGLVAGLKGEKDIEPLQLHFSHFAGTKSELDDAIKGEKTTVRKTIAALLGVDRKLNENQVRTLITTLMHRLEGHVAGTPPTAVITPHQQLRPALRTKHLALLKLYENAFNWLDKTALDKIYDDTAPEKDFKIDFETFGDLLLEQVTPDNRDRYLRGINEKTFKNTFKGKFAYLTAATTLKTAMKKPAEKEKVVAQLKKFLGSEELPPMDLATLLDKIKTLRERVSGDPAVPPTDATMSLKYDAFIESLKLVEDAFTAADVLDELFGDEKAPEKPIDYANIGHEIIKRTKTPADLRAFDKQFDENEMLLPYGPLLSKANMLAEATANPENLKLLLGKLFAISGTLTNDKIKSQATLLRATLTRLPAADVPEAHELANVIDGIRDDVINNNILTPRLNYAAIGADILARVRTAADVDTLDGAMSMVEVELAVGSLFNIDTLVEEVETDLPSVQAKIRNLFGITGAVTRAGVIRQTAAIQTALGLLSPTPLHIGRLLRNIERAHDLLTWHLTPIDPKILAKLYGKEAAAPEALGSINYADFGNTVLALPAGDAKEQGKFLRAFIPDNFSAEFGALLNPAMRVDLLDTIKGKNLVKAQAIALFKLSDPFDDLDVKRQAAALRTRLGNGAVETPKYGEFNTLLSTVVANLSVANIDAIFADIDDFQFQAFIDGFRLLGDRTKTAAAIRGYSSSGFRANLNYAVSDADLDGALADTNPDARNQAIEQIRALVGVVNGPIRADFVDTVIGEFEAKVGTVNAGTLDADGQARRAALLKDLGDIRTTLTPARLKALFEGKVAVDETPFVINYRQFANEVFTRVNTPTDQKRFLAGLSLLDFEAAFTAFYPVAEMKNRVKTPEGRTKMKEQIEALFYPLGSAPNKVSRADMMQQSKLMLVKLGAGAVDKPKWTALVDKMTDDIMQTLQVLLDEIYADEPEVTDVKLERFGNILKTEVQNKEEAIAFLRGYRPSRVRDHFTVLTDGKAFDAIVAAGEPATMARLQERLRALVGMDMGPITAEYLTQVKGDFENYLNLAEPATLPADLKAKYDHVTALLGDVVTVLGAGKRLEKLFNPEQGINYEELGSQISNLNADQIIPFLKELKIAKVGEIYGVLGHPKTFEAVRTKEQREELRAKIEGLFGISPLTVPSNASLKQRAQELLQTLGSHPSISLVFQAQLNLNQLQTKFNMYINMLNDEQLENIYKGAGRKKT